MEIEREEGLLLLSVEAEVSRPIAGRMYMANYGCSIHPRPTRILMFNLEFMAMEFEKIKSEWDVLLKLDKNLCFDIMDKNKKIDELKTQVSYLKDTLTKYEPNELH